MYFVKTKRQFDQQETKELNEKREKLSEKQQKDGSSSAAASSPKKKNDKSDRNEFVDEELPDGACFRPRVVASEIPNDESAVRPAEYIGSFSVTGEDQNARAEYVQQEMDKMRSPDKSKKILLVISLSGVKVCSSNGESVYMAHALKRISYATCEPEFCQFAFIAREPKGHISSQFCHVFMTKSAEEVEELNTIIGNAFKMAYAQQRVKQPTFNELIEQQLVEQKQKYQEYQEQAQKMFQQRLQEIATPTPFSEKAQQRMEMRRQSSSEDTLDNRDIISGKNKLWYTPDWFPTLQAKHQVDRVKHKTPGIDPPSGNQPRSPPTRPVSDAPLQHITGSPPSGTNQIRKEYKRTQSDIIVDKTPTGRPRSEIDLEGLRRNSQPHSPQSCPNFNTQDNSNNASSARSSAQHRVCSPSRGSKDSERKLKGSPVHQRVCSPGRSSPTRSTGSVRSSYDNVNTSSRSPSAVSRNSSMDILSSLGFSNNSGKTKGSPVTALKEAIDRGYMNDGHVIARDIAKSHGIDIPDLDGYLLPKQSKDGDKVNPNMLNRPLPAIPKENGAHNGDLGKSKNWTSLDDDVLTPQHRVQMRRDHLKDSPKRRQPRPHSEVFADHKFVDLDGPGCYMYGSRSQVHQQVSRSKSTESQQQKLQLYSQQLQMQCQPGAQSSQMKYQNGGEGSYEYADEGAIVDKNRPG